MAVNVAKLFKNATMLYNMKLVAGRNGLDNLVTWVHIIEDDDVSKFLHGEELVFTAGIKNNGGKWLMNFAKRLYEVGASAFVVNLGPYVKEIPSEVIEYCNDVGMPLFTIPWETRMVDMTRDFCHRIMRNENVEMSMATTIKNIIFKIGDLDTQILQMERYGYMRDARFCVVAISFDNNSEINSTMDRMKGIAERVARSIHELYISFVHNNCLIVVLVDYGEYEVKQFIEKFIKQTEREHNKIDAYLGVSPNIEGIDKLGDSFDKAISSLTLALKKEEHIKYYDELDIYKILLASKDKRILIDYYNDTLGKLAQYDEDNNIDLEEFLKVYLDNNGSQQIVAEKLFIHRNTVNNQLKKIEKITGYNPLELDNKFKFIMAFLIKDII